MAECDVAALIDNRLISHRRQHVVVTFNHDTFRSNRFYFFTNSGITISRWDPLSCFPIFISFCSHSFPGKRFPSSIWIRRESQIGDDDRDLAFWNFDLTADRSIIGKLWPLLPSSQWFWFRQSLSSSTTWSLLVAVRWWDAQNNKLYSTICDHCWMR